MTLRGCCLVEHPIDILRATADGADIANIHLKDIQSGIRGEIAPMAGREIIERGDFMSVCDLEIDDV